MIYPTQLRAVALCRPIARLYPVQTNFSPIFVRAKSLSAIHRGLRNSERAQYGEPRSRAGSDSADTRDRDFSDRRPRRQSTSPPSRNHTPARRDEFLDKFSSVRTTDPGARTGGGRNWRQEQKLRKKMRKKDEEKKARDELEAEGGGRRTRRRRFADPENEFGSRSLVHQMKYGDLKEVADNLSIQEPVKPRSFRETRRERTLEFGNRDALSGSDNARNERRSERPERRFEQSEQRFDWSERRSDRPQERFDRSERQFDRPERRFDRPQQSFDRRDRSAPRQDNARSDRWNDQGDESADASGFKRGRKKEMMNMTIKYTTAASQFLYGRSVVKAALEQSRRKLYNLYIYGGENRRDNKDNTIMTRLAEKLGVPITIVPTDEQRIMDKMSMGRPHNGFVLEASPLPQLPIKSLGRLEENPSRLGFHVNLDFQTKEEETVNGTDTFIRRANDVMPKPFVLLCNEIIDPGNLGGIIRTASYLGIDAVGITSRGSSTLTPVVLKSAAGAVEEISLFTVDDPLRFIEDSGKAGWKTFAAVAPPDRKLVRKHGDKFVSTDAIEAKSPLNEHPCVLVLGNEGHGLSKPLKVAADYELSVPRFVQGSCIDSLNVSVAAGLLCHSFVKEPVTEVKVEAAEQKAEPAKVESKVAAAEAEVKPIEETKDEILSDSKQAEEKEPEEVESVTKPEEKQAEEKKAKENDDTVF
ncbi:hypothetical protein FSARC_4950 [Fusarium sarcochroum]|uniref:rRNA methyltransferase 1, mitochondrial n=1 Tax=Fusarium sarcochroum TaxID=1208366 RepID=A0A8H4XAX8_9HYPO|nr:hypothetical protein FSARC_4950 [Fusarium sarcochroum]